MDQLRTGDRRLISDLNTALVLQCIRRDGPLSRVEVASRVGLGKSTVTGIVRRLLVRGLVRTLGSGESSGGRPPEMLAFDPKRYCVVGLKLQPTGILACRTDMEGTILVRHDQPLAGRDPDAIIAGLEQAYRTATKGVAADDILGCGVALPGLVDAQHGISISPHFFPWKNLPLQHELEAALDVPVLIENDARAAALGEKWCGHGTRLPHFVFLSVGIGIGAGVVLSGELLAGDVVGGGHMGHTTVDAHGPPCRCGARGCLEVMANDAALLRYARQFAAERLGGQANEPGGAAGQLSAKPPAISDFPNAAAVVGAAKQGNLVAAQAVERMCEFLGVGLSNAVKLLGVAHIVVGGETGTAGDTYLAEVIAKATRPHLFPEMAGALSVMPTPLGNDVWLVGTAALILEAVFRAPIYSTDGRGPAGVAIS